MFYCSGMKYQIFANENEMDNWIENFLNNVLHAGKEENCKNVLEELGKFCVTVECNKPQKKTQRCLLD